jgi:hypothetical protein
MSPDIEEGVLEHVAVNRRKLVRDLVLGTAFAAPAIATFEMRSLTAFAANCLAPNQTVVAEDNRFRIKFLKFNRRSSNDVLRLKLKVYDVETDENVGTTRRKVKLRKITPEPAVPVGLPRKFRFARRKGRYYWLKLDTSQWAPGNYELAFTVGRDRTRFKVFAVVGNCP